MRCKISILLLFSACLIFAQDPPQLTASFSDGSLFQGSILQVDPEKQTLRFHSPELAEKATLSTRTLEEIEYQARFYPEVEHDHYALVISKPRIDGRPRDQFRGQLTGISQEKITLDTWYAGPLTLERQFISDLKIFAQAPNSYFGPNNLSEWICPAGKTEDHWKFEKRTLIALGKESIARKVELPDRARLSFSVGWKGSPYFNVIFLSNDGKANYPLICYRMSVHRNSISLERNGPKERNDNLLPRNRHRFGFLSQEKAQFEIYLDRHPEGANAVYIDGIQIGSWTETDDREKMGEWLQFIPQNTPSFAISDISISHWDGLLPQSHNPSITKPQQESPLKELKDEEIKLNEHEIHLNNNDSIIGNIQKIEKGHLTTETVYGSILLPLKRTRSINVAGPVPNEPEPMLLPHEVRAWFHDGGFVHMQLISLDDKTLRGKSQVFGEASFDLRAFSRIEFNVWERFLDRTLNQSLGFKR